MNQKTAIITGGSRGIGAATAKLLSRNGYNVVLTYFQNQDLGEAVAESIRKEGGEAAAVKYRSGSPADAENLVTFAKKEYGRIDLIVNNAGTSYKELMTYTPDADWLRVIDENLNGVFYLCRAAVREMLKADRGGSIVNVSSIYGIAGGAAETAYSAAKAGVIGFTKALAKELAMSGISVNCVAPGAVDTEMNAYLSDTERAALMEEIPFGRFGTAEEIAETILFLAKSSYLTGQVISPNGGALI